MKEALQCGPVWINGVMCASATVSVDLNHAGALYGLGLFETVCVLEGRAIDLEAHLARLESSAHELELACPDRARLQATVDEVAHAAPRPLAWLRLVLTGTGPWWVWSGRLEPAADRATAWILPWRRNPRDPLVRHKTLSYAANRIGSRAALNHGADEGLWLNVRGRVAEGCRSNVFVVSSGRLFTPATGEGILPGTVRRQVIRAAKLEGVTVHEGRLRPPRLVCAQEAFLTSSLRGVQALVAVNGRRIGSGNPGPLTRRLAMRVQALRHRTGHEELKTPP